MIDAHVHLEKGPLTKEYVQEFVDCALSKGIDTLYIEDHSHRFKEFLPIYEPYRFLDAQDAWLNARFKSTLNEYLELIDRCRKEDYPIKVLFGIEICYQDCIKDILKDILKDYRFDFLIGSIHAIDCRIFDCSFSKENLWDVIDIDHIYEAYFEQEYFLIESDIFTQIGHPDQIKMMNIYPGFELRDQYVKFAQLAKAHDIYVENNTGIHYRYHHEDIGLNKEFLTILKKHGCKVITASDAHTPQDVGNDFQLL